MTVDELRVLTMAQVYRLAYGRLQDATAAAVEADAASSEAHRIRAEVEDVLSAARTALFDEIEGRTAGKGLR